MAHVINDIRKGVSESRVSPCYSSDVSRETLGAEIGFVPSKIVSTPVQCPRPRCSVGAGSQTLDAWREASRSQTYTRALREQIGFVPSNWSSTQGLHGTHKITLTYT